ELESFRAYARMFPDRTILLVDTYDYRQGVRNAIIVARELKAKGFRLFGVRLDSGDLAKESKKIRAMLDRSGLNAVKIVVSGNLDEYKIERLRRAKAPIDIFGVGTNMGVSADAPYCDVIYKISEITDRRGVFTPTMKLSAHKVTFPGRKQVYRRRDRRGRLLRDVLVLEGERGAGTPLLSKVMERGKPCSAGTRLEQVRRYVQNQLADLPSRYKRLKPEAVYPVAKSARLVRLSLAKKQQLERSRRAERLEYVATKRMK
ncbi:MAG: nicotinate phosphoribosyltransferase, partial [Candidatus Omnitrophica bacterium]|nr:nicotinate phosphoribosyltransferase [Candidatus Omnitrophota bacterium]